MLQMWGERPSRYSRYNTLRGNSNIRANIPRYEFRGSLPGITPFSAMFAGVQGGDAHDHGAQ